MRVFYDFEFLEHQPRTFPVGRKVWTIEPISLGMKTEDGRRLYYVNADAPWRLVTRHAWLRANVWPSLPHDRDTGKIDMTHPDVQPLWFIRSAVSAFLERTTDTELWAWHGASDFVSLMWLWGRWTDVPSWVPRHTNDIKQLQRAEGIDDVDMPSQPSGLHNALKDAEFNEVRYNFIKYGDGVLHCGDTSGPAGEFAPCVRLSSTRHSVHYDRNRNEWL